MTTQLPEDARRRLEAGQGDLGDRCWHNVQRLHKWSGKLERDGPSGEDADYYESMGPRSLFLGPIVWDGPTDKRKLGWDEITAALRVKVRDLLGRYARELAALAGGEWWSLGLTGVEFEARLAAVLQSVLADLKNVAKEADSDLGLGLEIAPLVADLNTGLQAWCEDYVERYGAHIGLYGTAETGLGAQQVPEEVPHAPPGESNSASEKDASGQAARTKPTDRKRTEADRRALVLGTAGLPGGKPQAGTFASNPKIRKLVEEHPEFSPLVNQVTQIDRARAEAEVAFRERELAEQWGTWSGVHPWEDKPDLETTDCPWWVAGAEYVFRIAFAWRTHSPSTPDRTEAALAKQVELAATWVYWKRVFVHDCVPAPNSNAENFLSERNAKRFADFAFLFCLRKFAEKDLDEWRKRAALLTGADGDLAGAVGADDRKATASEADQGAVPVTLIDGSAPTAVPDSDSSDSAARIDVSGQPAQPESGTAVAQASMAARASSSSDASAMDSPTRIKFETGLALAEVTLDQDLKDHGPSLEIARKYVTNATLTLARCILTPNCGEPYEAIRRAYDFAEWFAAETMKTAWVWLCVFGEMDTSGKLEKHKREGRTEDGAPKGMSESELREWHGCLSGVAHEALDEFVPEFWQERLKYFSDIAGGAAPTESEIPRATDGNQDPGVLAQEPSDSHVDSDVPKQGDTKQRVGKVRKGDATLLGQKQWVSFRTAEEYLDIGERQRQKMVRDGRLVVEGAGQNRKITVESLLKCLPSENPN